MSTKNREGFNIQDAARDNLLGSRLSLARREKKIRQGQFVKQLEEYGISMTASSYSCWETGVRTPNAYQLLALCRALDIEDISGYFLEGAARGTGPESLNDEGQALVEQYIRLLKKSGDYDRDPGEAPEEAPDNIVEFDLYLQAASAGTGQFLDSDVHDRIALPRSVVPAGTQFALRITGDSMEPAYYSDQLAFVKRTVTLRPGDVGIFLLDGESYIKRYEEEMPGEEEMDDYLYSSGNVQKKPVLVSFNPKYDPIRVTQHNNFAVVGKVLNRTGFDFRG